MFTEPLRFLRRSVASGMHQALNTAPPVVPGDDTAVVVVVAAVFGAFCGLLLGLILKQVLPLLSMLTGKWFEGTPVTLGSTALGSAVFVILALTADEE